MKMGDAKAVGKMVIVGVLIIVIVVAGVAGYYLMAPQAKMKDTLIIGTTDSVETCIDPARAYDFFGWEIIQSMGCPLVEYKAGATGSATDLIPSLATSWTVSDDGLQWTFNLRQGVKYDDNSEFTAEDVKYTFDRGIGIADEDGAFVGIGYGDIIQSVTAVSTYVVRFDLKIPFAAFLSLMACQASYIVDPAHAPKSEADWSVNDVVVYKGGDARGSHPMGLGPYRLKSWTRVAGKDTELTLEANPLYWDAASGYPKTKTIVFDFVADAAGLATAMTAGDVDIAFRQLSASDITTMKSNTNLKVWDGAGAFIQYLCMQQKNAPFNNVKIREAVAAAINRTTLVDTVFQGQAVRLYSMIPIGMFGHTDAFQAIGDPNYTRTRELLGELGYNENNKFSFTLWYETSGHYPQSQQQALVLESSLEASGVISVSLEGRDWAAYKVARSDEIMQAYIYGWYPDYIDPDDYIYPFVQSSGGSWLHHNYASSQMDQLIAWARGNTTEAARTDLYGQIQNLMVTDVPIIPMYQSSAYAVSNLKVKGVYLDITQQWRNWLVYAEE
ncbi:MAG TPA: ABC transporter substrate-binding protein [Candidatus Bathyarchaeia archaeon]